MKYHFNIVDGDRVVEDIEGVELASPTIALKEAQDAARELLAQKVRNGDVIDGQEFHVKDDLGTRLFVLPFKDVLRFE